MSVGGGPRGRRSVRAGALLLLLGLGGAAPARAQGPPIAELERLAAEREARIIVLEARLRRLEGDRDSLVAAKRRAEPGSAQFEAVSNQILENANRIRPVQRDLRTLREDVRNLKTELFQRYNAEIAQTNQRIEALKRGGRTPQTSAELRRLIDRMPSLLRARERLAAEIEETQEDLYLPEIVYDPTDGARELRNKIAAARDAVDRIDQRIGEIEERIESLNRTTRMREEADRLRRDIELWGDDRVAQSASEIEAILEQRRPGGALPRGADDPFDDPEERVRRLRARLLELRDRRAEFERKADLFADLLREFYR